MTPTRSTLLALLVSLSLVLATVPAGVTAIQMTDTQTATDTLTVDRDGSADYRSIQAAVDAADSGDTVAVRPGVYYEQITVAENVTLVAPDRAILDGSRFVNGTALRVTGAAAPNVTGFTMRNYRLGVVANDTTGDWTLRDSTVIRASVGVYAPNASGNWTIADSAVSSTTYSGVFARATTGEWTIRDTRFVEVGGDGVDVRRSTGDWTVSDIVVDRSGADGVDASGTTGDWTVRNTTVRRSDTGVKAIASRGDWTVTDLTVQRSDTGLVTASTSGDWTVSDATVTTREIGVFTARTTGAWTIRNSTIDSRFQGIHAAGTNGSWTISDSSITVSGNADAIGVDARDAAEGWSLDSVDIQSTGLDVAE